MSNIFEQTFKKHSKIVVEHLNEKSDVTPENNALVDALNKVEGVQASIPYYLSVKHNGRPIIIMKGDTFTRGGTDDGYTSGTKLTIPGAKFIVYDADHIVKLREAMETAGFKVSEIKVGHYESGGHSRSGRQPMSRGSVAYFGILDLPPVV